MSRHELMMIIGTMIGQGLFKDAIKYKSDKPLNKDAKISMEKFVRMSKAGISIYKAFVVSFFE